MRRRCEGLALLAKRALILSLLSHRAYEAGPPADRPSAESVFGGPDSDADDLLSQLTLLDGGDED